MKEKNDDFSVIKFRFQLMITRNFFLLATSLKQFYLILIFWPKTESFQEVMMIMDMITYLQDDILVKIDRGSMFSA